MKLLTEAMNRIIDIYTNKLAWRRVIQFSVVRSHSIQFNFSYQTMSQWHLAQTYECFPVKKCLHFVHIHIWITQYAEKYWRCKPKEKLEIDRNQILTPSCGTLRTQKWYLKEKQTFSLPLNNREARYNRTVRSITSS